ncbi:MAG TPA: hypothetical protein VNI61_04275 [Gemmatimonadales bacterium]|nr:hypothetical protein [Gemmatimonadales bacterium]
MSLLTLCALWGCDPLQRPGDTTGEQSAARWEWRGRLVVETDSLLTLVRLRIDTTALAERHDVLLARFDFDPSAGAGDEYALTVALDLGPVRDLPLNRPLPLGPPPARIPAYATVSRLGTPLRPDSVRGTFLLAQRGLRQLTGRIDATLYFTAWEDPTQHAAYELRQKIFGVK